MHINFLMNRSVILTKQIYQNELMTSKVNTTFTESYDYQEPYGHLTSASALIDILNMASVGKIRGSIMKENMISSQRYAIVTTHFFHFKWHLTKSLNFRISFQIVSDDHPCNLMI